ncbi:DUF5686 family protein [Flavisolibacter tropicus]|nr:DUF5686 family protein [Flavisolibacter tropicus]
MMPGLRKRLRAIFLFLLFFSATQWAAAQARIITGIVTDQHSAEPVPFASVRFKKSGIGKLADSSGAFHLEVPAETIDTLQITSVGYEDFNYPIDFTTLKKDSIRLQVQLIPGKIYVGVVVKAKVNRGLQLWKRMVKFKPKNNQFRFDNFTYELYNKLELDLKNIKKDKWVNAPFMKPFSFIFDNIDTSDGVPILPAYMSEAISQYYYQKSPVRRREVFKGVKTLGIQNESAARLLGGMDQVVNVYNNFIPVFDRQFVSPLSDNGDNYYNYKVLDTQYVNGRRLVHFIFAPKRKGENTFEGDGWVHDSTFAIQKLNLRLGKDANVNFVDQISLIQEYQLINDSTWFLAKDKFVVDISPLNKSGLSFIGRKTTTYRNIVINDPSVERELAKNKKTEETVLPQDALVKTDTFWEASRHEDLSATEKGIYKMVDTLLGLPAFKRATNTINFISTGYYNINKFQIGPWQNWISGNYVEGLRLRFDLATNSKFSQKVVFHGYGAYGFKDQKFKGEFDAMYLLNRSPRSYLYGSYVNDFDYGQNYYGEISSDNIFALAIRKNGVPIKYIKLEEYRLDGFKEWHSGLSVLLSGRHKAYNPVQNLPSKELFTQSKADPLTTFEASVRLRFAYLEKFLENTFYRTSLGSPYPIIEAKYTKGISGINNSAYDYHKIMVGVSNFKKIPPFGSIYYNVFAGKTFGTLPYVFLDIAPGNEIYYYNRYAYNMINRYEFIHDKYAGINFEHNFGNGLFRLLPTRRFGFRQFWTAKALWGRLSDANKQLNFVGQHPFQTLDGKTYLELGTGVDNIFRVLRVDFVWRALPSNISPTYTGKRFGVFFSFRFSF